MSDELQRELRKEKGYSSILEGILSERKPPRNPYMVFDSTGTIRFVSPSFESAFKYKPEQLIGKKYQDVISPDLYESALRELAYRIDVVRDHPEELGSGDFIERFKKDIQKSRELLSKEEKVAHIERLIRAYSHEQNHEVKEYDSEVRVRLGNGECVTIKDKFYLRKHQTDHGWEYAAAMVVLDPTEADPSMWKRFNRWFASWFDLKPYQLSTEPVIAIHSLESAKYLENNLKKLINANRSSPDKPLVLDFREVDEVKESICEGIFSLVKDLAQSDKLIIGNAQEAIRKTMTKYVERVAKATEKKPYQLQFRKLIYPPVKTAVVHGPESVRELNTYQELEKYVEEGIRELETFANKVPDESVRSAEKGADGQGNDVRAAGEGAQQQS